MARAIQPFHTRDDGDALWVVSTREANPARWVCERARRRGIGSGLGCRVVRPSVSAAGSGLQDAAVVVGDLGVVGYQYQVVDPASLTREEGCAIIKAILRRINS